jgi:hypothetical protein
MFQDLSSINNAGRAGDFVRARNLALDATQSYPNNAQAWYYLAQADGQLGNVKEATTSLARADQLDPTHSFVGNVNSYNALRAKLATVNQAVIVHDQNDYSVSHPGEGSHPFFWGFIIVVFALGLAYVIKRLIDNGAASKAAAAAEAEARALKARADAKLDSFGTRNVAVRYSSGGSVSTPRPASVAPVYHSGGYSVPPTQAGSTTIINNGSNSDGLVTGMLLGEVIADSGRRDTYVEHDVEVVHDRGYDSGSSSSGSPNWDSGSYSSPTPSPSSSSWDSGSSSSSSWDSGSSSSSWDSGSSSFDSGSSFSGGDSSGW